MKKLLILILSLFLATAAFSQTQKGFVKTKGRMVDGKLVPGEGLKGAVVAVKGRTPVLVNKESGEFSFPMRDERFSFDSVRKNGYQLVDPDACARTYKLSGNPIYFVMETPEQQLQDKLNAERKIRRNLQKQLQEREDEIENLKAEQKLTDEEYRQALQKLYQDQESNEQLISDMAKRYSELDYDQLDEFYRQVSYFIENGELTKADSLLNTRGNVIQQIEQEKQKGQAIHEQKRKIKKAEALHAANIDELAKRCYGYYENFAAQHLNDTAAYYLELRASLDTTNIDWQNNAGVFIRDYIADYEKAMNYFQKAFRQAISQCGEKSEKAVECYNNIGIDFYYQDDYNKALENIEKSLEIEETVAGENLNVAIICNTLCSIHTNISNYSKALEYGERALAIQKSRNDNINLANTYNNLGVTYFHLNNDSLALKLYEESINLCRQAFGENNKDVATCYNNIAYFYINKGHYAQALEYQEKALTIRKLLFGENHPDVAQSYNNIGYIYIQLGDYLQARKNSEKAMEIFTKIIGKNSKDVAVSYLHIGDICVYRSDYIHALEMYDKALNILKQLFGEKHPQVAQCYNNIGYVYIEQKSYPKAIENLEIALEIRLALYGENHSEVAVCYNNIGYVYGEMGDYTQALVLYEKALAIYKEVFGDNHIDTAHKYNNIGSVYYQQGDYVKALECYQKAYDTWKEVLGEDHKKTQIAKDGIIKAQQKLQESQKK